jgi:hypothetical protein
MFSFGRFHAVKVACALSAALAVASCSSITTPDTGPGTGTTGPVVDMSGNWTGTLEASNLPTQTITLLVAQLGACVDGSYATPTLDVTGAISGFAAAAGFSGQFSYQRTDAGGGACVAAGTVSGSVDATGIHWTSTNLTAISSTCVGGVPALIDIKLHR